MPIEIMLAKLLNLITGKLTVYLITFCLGLFLLTSSALAGEDNINLESGAKVFKANCAGCHVKGGNIVRRGKNLKLKALRRYKVDSEEAIASLVTNGKGIMSAYGDKLTQQEIADVSAYVMERAEQNWKQ
ncbi:MAG: c-type cytochrome [Cyanobacteria bacterium P01_G01_bin.19]